jgi:hypothetical protein
MQEVLTMSYEDDDSPKLIPGLIEIAKLKWTRFANWRLVRWLGELRLLTNVSYVMLVLVPLLAATWPAVRLAVNQYSRAAESYARTLTVAATSLNQATTRLLGAEKEARIGARTNDGDRLIEAQIAEAVREVDRVLRHLQSQSLEMAITAPTLPWSWAAGFFAAVFVVMAHTIYQSSAPSTVQAYRLEQFVSLRQEEYSRHPTDDALRLANHYIDIAAHENIQWIPELKVRRFLRNIVETSIGVKRSEKQQTALRFRIREEVGNLSLVEKTLLMNHIEYLEAGGPSDIKELSVDIQNREVQEIVELIKGEAKYALGSVDEQKRKLMMDMSIITQGAAEEYAQQAKRRAVLVPVVAVLYLASAYIIFAILYRQMVSVAAAAGWESIWRLFGRA